MSLQHRLQNAAKGPAASPMLFGVSMLESIIFPVPPDVMLIPMVLVQKHHWQRLALITTAGSIFGAIVGYFIGLWAFDTVGQAILTFLSAHDTYAWVEVQYQAYGVAILLIASITPIPFKVFTLASGALHMAFVPYIVAAFCGRALRFYLVGGLTAHYGQRAISWMKNKQIAAVFSILCIIIIVIGYELLHG